MASGDIPFNPISFARTGELMVLPVGFLVKLGTVVDCSAS